MKSFFGLVPSLDIFKTLKLASSSENNSWHNYGSFVTTFGVPDIPFEQVVFIEDTKQIYTMGEIYSDISQFESRMSAVEEAVQAIKQLTVSDDSTNLAEISNDTLSIKTSKLNEVILAQNADGVYIESDTNTNKGLASAVDVAIEIANNEMVIATSLNDLNDRLIYLNDTVNKLQEEIQTLKAN